MGGAWADANPRDYLRQGGVLARRMGARYASLTDELGGYAMKFEDLSPDLQERAKGCKSAEDILALAKDEGYELSDDELESVSGGDRDCLTVCREHGSEPDCSRLRTL